MHHANPAGSPERGRNKEASSLPAPLMLPAQQSALLSLINSPATLESLGAKKERAPSGGGRFTSTWRSKARASLPRMEGVVRFVLI